MGIWTSAPQVSRVPQIPPNTQVDQATSNLYAYIKEMANVMTAMKNDLEYMVNGHLDANNIRAKSITADRISVDELSAISANLGHITAGLIESIEIYGSYIATLKGTYPRCEMNSANNDITSYFNSSKYVSMKPVFGGDPALIMESSGYTSNLQNGSGVTSLSSELDIILSSTIGDILLQPGNSVKVDNFYYLIESFTGLSLQQKLDELSDRITALGG